MDIILKPIESPRPTALRDSALFPELKCLGSETELDHIQGMPIIRFDSLAFEGVMQYFRDSFDPTNKKETGLTLIGNSTETSGITYLNIRGFRTWAANSSGDMHVNMNFHNDIGQHVDPQDREFGDVLGSCHLHPELGARPSNADYTANRSIQAYLENNHPNRNNKVPPFFMIYNAERNGKTHSISIHWLDSKNGNRAHGHVRIPALYIRGQQVTDPQIHFYDPSQK